MNCPVDGETLLMSERKGVEIDYCPKCRGVWLDRGELDKLTAAADQDDDERWEDRDRYRERDRDDDHRERDRSFGDRGYGDPGYGGHRKKKKKSFLSEMFEMGGDD